MSRPSAIIAKARLTYLTVIVGAALGRTGGVSGCWFWSCSRSCRSWSGVTIARDCTLSVAALLPRGAVRVGLAVGALAVRARVALRLSRAVVCRTRLLAVVATDVHVVVADGANRNGVSAVC